MPTTYIEYLCAFYDTGIYAQNDFMKQLLHALVTRDMNAAKQRPSRRSIRIHSNADQTSNPDLLDVSVR